MNSLKMQKTASSNRTDLKIFISYESVILGRINQIEERCDQGIISINE
jgi:hypothetical protein